MKDFLIKWLINIITLFIVIHIIAGVSINSWQSIILAAFVLGLLNAFLRPFIIMVTLPLTIFSFGFFTLVINAFMFYLASKFVSGFVVSGFWSAFWAAILFSIVSFLLNIFLNPKIVIQNRSGKMYYSNEKKYKDAIDVEGKVEDSNEENKNG